MLSNFDLFESKMSHKNYATFQPRNLIYAHPRFPDSVIHPLGIFQGLLNDQNLQETKERFIFAFCLKAFNFRKWMLPRGVTI